MYDIHPLCMIILINNLGMQLSVYTIIFLYGLILKGLFTLSSMCLHSVSTLSNAWLKATYLYSNGRGVDVVSIQLNPNSKLSIHQYKYGYAKYHTLKYIQQLIFILRLKIIWCLYHYTYIALRLTNWLHARHRDQFQDKKYWFPILLNICGVMSTSPIILSFMNLALSHCYW